MTTERLSAFRLYTAALKMIWTEKVHLLRLVSPILILALAYIAIPFSEMGLAPVILLYILAIYCFAVSAVHIHVNIVEKRSFADSPIFVKPKATHFAYLGVLILFQIANGIFGQLAEIQMTSPFAEIFFAIIVVCISIYIVRFYFILPALTVGDRLSQMIEYTRGRLLRFYIAGILFLLTIIPVLTAAILSGVFFMNREDSSLGIAFIILIIMYSCFNVFISVVYREFRDEWQVTSSVGTES